MSNLNSPLWGDSNKLNFVKNGSLGMEKLAIDYTYKNQLYILHIYNVNPCQLIFTSQKARFLQKIRFSSSRGL